MGYGSEETWNNISVFYSFAMAIRWSHLVYLDYGPDPQLEYEPTNTITKLQNWFNMSDLKSLKPDSVSAFTSHSSTPNKETRFAIF